ncbi:lipid-A-disaccharide synthase [Candidatus Saganbacteria bacterium]|nr:lipid-A-disaccharide synthase [Candidatus Saganbacteria bacterium]
MLSAGEVSGDSHGQTLVYELRKLFPDAYFFGLGSEKLLAEGVDIKCDIVRRGTIGIFETLPNVIPVFFAYLKMVDLMKKEQPDVLILIDSQGINMPLARAAKKLGIKTVYYIAPQEWLWGTEKGVKKVAKTIDLIVAIFAKEYEIYKKAGAKVIYSGHPLVDSVKAELAAEAVRKNLLGNIKGPIIALCPGSRLQEIRGLLPLLLKAGELIKAEIPDANFIIPAASTEMIKEIFDLIGDFRPQAVVGHTYDILAAADVALCASGTINLEASLLDTPNIMVYKLNPLTYFVGKYILKIGEKLRYFSMPNILLNEAAIPELVMKEAYPNKIAQTALRIIKGPKKEQDKLKTAFAKLRNQLGEPGVVARTARAIADFIG